MNGDGLGPGGNGSFELLLRDLELKTRNRW